MMVEGKIQGQKIREGHWISGGNLRIKIENKPELGKTEEITLRYATTQVPTQVVLVSWNETYNEVMVEVVRK